MSTITERLDVYSAALGEQIAREQQVPSSTIQQRRSSTSPALDVLIARQRKRMSGATVNPGDRSFARTSRQLLANLGDAAQDVAGTAVSAGAIGYVTSKLTSGDTKESHGHIAQAATASLTAATTMLVKSAVGTLVHGSKLDDVAAQQETYKKLVKQTTPDFLAQYPEEILTEVSRIDKSLDGAIKTGSGDIAWYKQRIRHRELVLLARPMAALDLTHWSNPPKMRVLQTELSELTKSYPQRNHSTIETLAQRIMTNSVAERPSRVQAYLYGPGGVGKTYFVEQLAAALGAPLVHVRVREQGSNSRTSGLEALLGVEWPAEEFPATEPDNTIIGELPMKMIEAGYVNPIVFIDELRLTPENINDLKLLLDPSKKTLKIGGYQAHLNWARCTVLVGSNDPLKDEALQTRMPQIVFDSASDETKRKVALRKVDSDAATYDQVLSRPDYQRLVSTCKSKLEELLFIDNETFPGTRFLEASSANLVHYVAAGLLAKRPKSSIEISDYLKTQYANAKGSTASTGPIHRN